MIIKKINKPQQQNVTKQTKKHSKLGDAEGIETIRHSKENMREFSLKTEAMA